MVSIHCLYVQGSTKIPLLLFSAPIWCIHHLLLQEWCCWWLADILSLWYILFLYVLKLVLNWFGALRGPSVSHLGIYFYKNPQKHCVLKMPDAPVFSAVATRHTVCGSISQGLTSHLVIHGTLTCHIDLTFHHLKTNITKKHKNWYSSAVTEHFF